MVELPKTLFLTSGGLVGSHLCAEFKRQGFPAVTTANIPEDGPADFDVDITDARGLAAVFSAAKPQLVILTAALTNVDLCESEKEMARRINVEGTRNVVELCKTHGARIVFFSSEYVFDGKNGPYSEEDIPCPINVYGRTKLEAESIVAATLPEHLVIRTTVIYGKEKLGKNFAARLINSLRQGNPVKVPVDQISSPTYAPDLSRVVAQLVKKEKRGIYNVVGSEVISRYDFALKVCEVFGLEKESVIPVTSVELDPPALRPLKAGLKIDKVIRETGLAIPGIMNSLQRFKKEING